MDRRLSPMFFILLLGLVFTPDANLSKVCTDLSNSSRIKRGVVLEGHTFMNITTEGLMVCANECLKRKRCQSFNFILDQGRCELNDIMGSVENLISAPDTTHSNISHFPITIAKTCSSHNCHLNENCLPQENGYTCLTEFPTTCVEIKQCAPGSVDGEYWIHLVNFDMVKARIYCHNMATDHPNEYLTLSSLNYGNYPLIRNMVCDGESYGLIGTCEEAGGEVWFGKIRLEIDNLEVVLNDLTFANYTKNRLQYGVAADCYSQHEADRQASCGPLGTFNIDLKRTGFAVDSKVQWAIVDEDSWKAWMISSRSDDGTEVFLNCGGFPGKCAPVGPLLLLPTGTGVPEDTAVEVKCNGRNDLSYAGNVWNSV